MYKCKKCQASEYTKAGFVNGKQRYKCKKCGCQQVIDWQSGERDAETFAKMYERLKRWNVKVYFSDRYSVYRDFIPREC